MRITFLKKIPSFRYLLLPLSFSCIIYFSCEKEEHYGETSLEITSPTDGSIVQDTIDIRFKIENGKYIDRIELFVDNLMDTVYLGVPENIKLYTTKYTNENHTIALRAVSEVGVNYWSASSTMYYWSNSIVINVQNPVAPSVPSLRATSDFQNSVTLSWAENEQLVTGYRVKRKLNDNEFVTLAELTADARTFVDNTLDLDTLNQYSYKIEVFTESISLHSNEVKLIYRAIDYTEYRSFDIPMAAEGKIAITPTASIIVITNYFENSFTVISLDDGSTTALEHVGGTMGLGMSNDGTFFAVQGSHDLFVDVWNLESLTLINQINTKDNGFEVAMNSAGDRLVVGDPIKIFSRTTGNLIKDFAGGHFVTRSISFSSNESLLLTAGNDNLVKLWNFETGALLKTFTGHSGHVGSSRFINNEEGVISGSYEDNTARIWDVKSGELMNSINFGSPVVGILNLKSQKLAIATKDGSVSLTDEDLNLTVEFGRSLKLFSIAYSSAKEIIAAYYQQKVVLYKPVKGWEIDQ